MEQFLKTELLGLDIFCFISVFVNHFVFCYFQINVVLKINSKSGGVSRQLRGWRFVLRCRGGFYVQATYVTLYIFICTILRWGQKIKRFIHQKRQENQGTLAIIPYHVFLFCVFSRQFSRLFQKFYFMWLNQPGSKYLIQKRNKIYRDSFLQVYWCHFCAFCFITLDKNYITRMPPYYHKPRRTVLFKLPYF